MNFSRYAIPGAPQRPAGNARRVRRRSRLLRSLIACIAVPIVSCQQAGVLDPQGPIGAAQLLLLINSTEIMLVVVVPVILATLGFAWWYRASNARASRASDEGYEGRIEFVLWSIPTLIVILLGGVIWIGSHQLDPRARSRPRMTRCGSRSWRSIGNGFLSTPIRALPRSISCSFRLGPRSTFVSLRQR